MLPSLMPPALKFPQLSILLPTNLPTQFHTRRKCTHTPRKVRLGPKPSDSLVTSLTSQRHTISETRNKWMTALLRVRACSVEYRNWMRHSVTLRSYVQYMACLVKYEHVQLAIFYTSIAFFSIQHLVWYVVVFVSVEHSDSIFRVPQVVPSICNLRLSRRWKLVSPASHLPNCTTS